MVQTHTCSLSVHTHTQSPRSVTHCPRSKGFPCNGEPADEVEKKHGCQTGTKSLSTSLPPPPCFLSLFLSLPPSLPPHLRLLRSPWRETSVPPLSAQRRWQRPSFSFITSLSLSETVHPCPLDRCPLLPRSVFLCLYIRPSPFKKNSSHRPSAQGENRGFWRKRGKENLK